MIRAKTRRTHGPELVSHHQRREPDLARLVWVFQHSYHPTFGAWISGCACGCAASCATGAAAGAGRGADHQRWPNAFFAAQGLFSLVTAHARSVNPLGGKTTTGEPDAGDPPVRFGGRGDRIHSALPTPICTDPPAGIKDESKGVMGEG